MRVELDVSACRIHLADTLASGQTNETCTCWCDAVRPRARCVVFLREKRDPLSQSRGCVHRSPSCAAGIATVCGARSCRCCVGSCPKVWSELMEMEGFGRWSDARMVRRFLYQRFKSIRARFRRFLRQPRPLATCCTSAPCACTEHIHILLRSSSFVVLLHPSDHASPPLPRTWSSWSTPPPSSSPPHWFVRPRDPGRPPHSPPRFAPTFDRSRDRGDPTGRFPSSDRLEPRARRSRRVPCQDLFRDIEISATKVSVRRHEAVVQAAHRAHDGRASPC